MSRTDYTTAGAGVFPSFPAPVTSRRDPTTSDKVSSQGSSYKLGQEWINSVTKTIFSYAGGGTWVPLGGGGAQVSTLTADNAFVVSPVSGNINIVGGTGATTVGTAGTITINVPGSGLDTFTIAGTSQSAAIDSRYIPLNGALTTITLPATFAVGDVVVVTGFGTGGWKLVAAAGDTIHTSGGDAAAALGLNSTVRYDSVSIVGAVANSDWVAESIVGVLTIA